MVKTKKEVKPAEASLRLQARVARMFELEKQIDELRKILSFPHNEGAQRVTGLKDLVNTASRAMQEARYAHTAAKNALENLVSQNRSKDEIAKAKADCETTQHAFEQAELQFNNYKERCDLLRAELKAVKAELEELRRGGSGLEEALHFQETLAKAKQRIPELQSLVAEQEKLIEEARAAIPSAEPLLERREDILAGLATGDATEGQLKAIDKDLETLNAQIADASAKAAETVTKAEATLAGLRRKLKEAEEDLDELLRQKPEVARLVLKTQAAVVYSDYLRLGKELGQKFVKLMSLNALICSIPERRRVDHSILLMAGVMKIPRFKIGPDEEAPSMSTVFAAAEQRIDLAREVEKSRLKGEGFTLLD